MREKVTTRALSRRCQQRLIAIAWFYAVAEAVGLTKQQEHALTPNNASRLEASISNRGSVARYSFREPWEVLSLHEVLSDGRSSATEELIPPSDMDSIVVVRREAAHRAATFRSAGSSPIGAVGEGWSAEALLQEEESSASVKMFFLSAIVLVALAIACVGAIFLVWQPMNAIWEERAFEQAAKNSLLSAVAAPNTTEDGNSEGQNSSFREDQLKKAWKTFLDDPILMVKSENLLRRVMQAFLEKEGFTSQMEDLFNGLAADGAETIKKEDMERVCESVSGSLRNMDVKGSGISTVDYESGLECSLAVVTVEDYGWLFDSYDEVFPETKPLDRKCFPGVVSLILIWNCVRTLHTARHMRAEEARHSLLRNDPSNAVSVELKIDLRSGIFPFEGRAEIEVNSLRAAAAASEPAAP